MNIGDLVLLLVADGSKLTPSVEKEAAKAGDAGAKTLGARLAGGLRTNGVKAFGTVAAAAFAVATAGALKLEEVQARIRTETSAGADEAVAAAKAINKIAGDEQTSLDAVSEIAIKVRRDLGATGAEADALTARFARFARVTRQDPAEAVAAFDDILDRWGLTAKDAAGIQDKLIVTGQKYGGTITANQKALSALAPSLKAMNVGLDDGIGLIGLFNASGLDAESQVRALNTAVKNLKPGQSLRDLIAEIAAIEDPTLRAQRAVQVFGARGGVELASALHPGMAGLDAFKVSTQDATGATDKAANVLDSTWGGAFRKLMSQAGAAVRGLGADFGVALSALGTLGSVGTALGLDRLIAKAFGSIPGSAIAKAAATAAGGAVGAVFSGAAFVAEKVAGAAGAAFDAIPGSAAVKAAAVRAGTALGATFGIAAAVAAAAAIVAYPIFKFVELESRRLPERRHHRRPPRDDDRDRAPPVRRCQPLDAPGPSRDRRLVAHRRRGAQPQRPPLPRGEVARAIHSLGRRHVVCPGPPAERLPRGSSRGRRSIAGPPPDRKVD